MAVPVDGTGTESVMAPLDPGVQKPPCRVGKQFRDCLVAAMEEKVKKPAGLNTRPAWLRQDRLGANPAVCRGDTGCQAWRPQLCSLKAADSYHLIPRPDSDGDGAGAAAQNCVGAVIEWLKGWNQAALTDSHKRGGEQLGW